MNTTFFFTVWFIIVFKFWEDRVFFFFPLPRIPQCANRNRCIGNCKADKRDDLPGLILTLTLKIRGWPYGLVVRYTCGVDCIRVYSL